MMSVSPELALAAAAAIKDKALEEQTLELIELREALRASQEVEVTGRLGSPVYCRGTFSDGDFRDLCGGGADLVPTVPLWEVKLINEREYEGGIPLQCFWSDMEVRIGGVVYATTSAAVGTACRVRGAGSSDSRDDVFCPISSGDSEYNRNVWMAINFRSLPEGPWMHLQSCARYNNSLPTDREDIFHKISHPNGEIAMRIPNQTADVTSVSFNGVNVLKLIKTVRRPHDAEFERKQKEKIAEIEALVEEYIAMA